MEALKLAFETVIVGVLALPWLAVALELFFGPRNGGKYQPWFLWSLLKRETAKIDTTKLPSAVAGVVLFVAAYFVGVVVTRASGDFFNDEMPSFFPTEDHIRSAEYCDLPDTECAERSSMLKTITTFFSNIYNRTECEDKSSRHKIIEDFLNGVECEKSEAEAIKRIFYLQEGALLLLGANKTDRLNQLNSQVLVLRGAAFNAFLTFMLCLFGLGGRSTRRLVWWVIPLTIAGVGFGLLLPQMHSHSLTDPPLMEFTCIVLGLAGVCVLVKGAPERKYGTCSLISFLAFGIAILGWWWSELLYDQQVFYSFYAQSQDLLHLAN